MSAVPSSPRTEARMGKERNRRRRNGRAECCCMRCLETARQLKRRPTHLAGFVSLSTYERPGDADAGDVTSDIKRDPLRIPPAAHDRGDVDSMDASNTGKRRSLGGQHTRI